MTTETPGPLTLGWWHNRLLISCNRSALCTAGRCGHKPPRPVKSISYTGDYETVFLPGTVKPKPRWNTPGTHRAPQGGKEWEGDEHGHQKAIILGLPYGYFAIDVDDPELYEAEADVAHFVTFEDRISSREQNGHLPRWHALVWVPESLRHLWPNKDVPGANIKGVGCGFIPLPGSIHFSGVPYEPRDKSGPLIATTELLQSIRNQKVTPKAREAGYQGHAAGGRQKQLLDELRSQSADITYEDAKVWWFQRYEELNAVKKEDIDGDPGSLFERQWKWREDHPAPEHDAVNWPGGTSSPGSPPPTVNSSSSSPNTVSSPSAPRDVALEYLSQRLGFTWSDQPPPLVNWCQGFYEHTGSYWEPIEDEKILQKLDAWLSTKFYLKATTIKGETEYTPIAWNPAEGKLNNVLASLRLLVRLPSEAEAGCLLIVEETEDGPQLSWQPGEAHVPLSDGILLIESNTLQETAKDYFDHWCVPVTTEEVRACVRGVSMPVSTIDDLEDSTPPQVRDISSSTVQAVHPSSSNLREKEREVSSIVVDRESSEKIRKKVARFSLDCLDWTDICPKWTAQLNLIFDSQLGPPVQLQEFFGYCLTTDTSFQRALLVYGRPRSGKGTLARVLKTLVGTIASPTVDNYAKGGFQLKRLIGKSVAITWDAKFTARVPFNAVERIKSIIGEDDVQIDRKYQDPWEGKLICKLVFIANEQPTFPDASGAVGSKFVILKTATSWVGEEDPEKEKILYDELPGILLWSLAGLKRLHSQGRFTETDESRAMTEDLERNASPVKQFLEEDLLIDVNAYQKSAEVYQAYTNWCWANGYSVLASNEFGKQLMALDNRIVKKRGKPEDDGKRPWYYAGVKIAPHVKLPEGISVN